MEFRKSNLKAVPVADAVGDDTEESPPNILVSKFDYSVENHFKMLDEIARLSGGSEFEYEEADIQPLSSSITFLSAWRDFCYQPRAIRFACESKTPQEKDVTVQMNLPQFSSAAIPKEMPDVNKFSSPLRKDFVMCVGGLVWALDWCPIVHQNSDFGIKTEFIAIAAHPSGSSYHKIGSPLSGRGLIQIWCLLNAGVKDHDVIPFVKVKPRKHCRDNKATKLDLNQPKRPRGRPRNNPLKFLAVDKGSLETPKIDAKEDDCRNTGFEAEVSSAHHWHNPEGSDADIVNLSEPWGCKMKPTEYAVDNSNYSNQHVQVTSDPCKILPEKGCLSKAHEQVTERDHNRNWKGCDKQYLTKSVRTSSKSRLTKCQTRIESQVNSAELHNLPQNCRNSFRQDPLNSMENIDVPPFEIVPSSRSISDDIALPRLVMGLAHNGRVAWDVKWRPSDSHAISKHIMGYLAVLLGNGALEVWEVPNPRTTKAIFSSCQKEGTDPRFLKLKPVFMCSVLKCGDRQSIPLTLEWSASAPNDHILAGCHDGVVAIWKFLANGSSKDTRPLLCFSADTVPIRALKWAPATSDPESANIIATAGRKGVRFWDIRDPIHPLWNIPSQKIIYSLDWLPNPRCVLFSYDDGEIMMYSLVKAACDVPVTGIPTVKTEQYGSHRYNCSSSSIWSIQVSCLTGMVAYCCSDGKVIHFQLTTKAVEKDPYRNREPHYLCGSLAEEESVLTVSSPLPNVPLPFKKSSNQETRAKVKISKFQTPEEHSSEGKLVAAQKSHASKTKNSRKENPKSKSSQASVCVDNIAENVKERMADEVEREVFPPKAVAIHRVRWNMNKGSERWLCYGGAAGIVRCQEVNLSRA